MKTLFISVLMLFFTLLITPELSMADQNSHIKILLTNIPINGLLKANFTQKRYMKDIQNPIISKGEILLWNGKGLIWDTKSPFPTSLLMAKSGLYQLEGERKIPLMQGQANGYEGMLLDTITKVLNGSFSEIKEFDVRPLPSSISGKWKVDILPPERIQKFISSLLIEGDLFISHIIIYRPNGDHDYIIINNQKVFEPSSLDRILPSKTRDLFDE
jgi:hypothetical protein